MQNLRKKCDKLFLLGGIASLKCERLECNLTFDCKPSPSLENCY